jgi:chorismate synthase
LEEKKRLQQKLLEAEKNKDVILSGFVSVQPNGSPVSCVCFNKEKKKSLTL